LEKVDTVYSFDTIAAHSKRQRFFKMTKTRSTTLCKRLNKAFPGCNAVTYNLWTGEEKTDQDAIWFRMEGECAPDGLPLYDYWSMDGEMYHPDLVAMLDKHGFHCEPHDAGTLMAFRG
jgi:hypothetical protein